MRASGITPPRGLLKFEITRHAWTGVFRSAYARTSTLSPSRAVEGISSTLSPSHWIEFRNV